MPDEPGADLLAVVRRRLKSSDSPNGRNVLVARGAGSSSNVVGMGVPSSAKKRAERREAVTILTGRTLDSAVMTTRAEEYH
jgi:hypothetical protein